MNRKEKFIPILFLLLLIIFSIAVIKEDSNMPLWTFVRHFVIVFLIVAHINKMVKQKNDYKPIIRRLFVIFSIIYGILVLLDIKKYYG